jgi:flagellar biosynthetic protein FliQ
MNIEMAVDILRMMISESIMLLSPLLTTAITVGVMVSLLQSITSIQEQTLTFVPKLVSVGLVIVVSANWMIRSLVEFTIMFIQKLPELAP